MPEPVEIDDALLMGDNDVGYEFFIGRVQGRWIGFAAADVPGVEGKGIFVFHEISDGPLLGLTDRDEAIRRVHAVATAPENGFGGVDRWYSDEQLRAEPAAYRCGHCDQLCCDGECELGEIDDYWQERIDEEGSA